MRIKIASNRVYEGTPEVVLKRLYETSTYKADSYRSYLDGFVQRLRPVKVWLEVPPSMSSSSDEEYARWLSSEMMRVGRWSETDAPTEEEKEAKAKAAAEAKAKAAAAKAAEAKAAPAKPAGADAPKPAAPVKKAAPAKPSEDAATADPDA